MDDEMAFSHVLSKFSCLFVDQFTLTIKPPRLTEKDGVTFLTPPLESGFKPIELNFQNEFKNLKINKNDLFAKAVGAKKATTCWDTTVGFADDSIKLLKLGFSVTGFERNSLLFDFVNKASNREYHNATTRERLSRFKLYNQDVKTLVTGQFELPEVIYLDPMFPDVSNKSLPNKKMQILQSFIGKEKESDTEELLKWALSLKVKRVVLKRPNIAPIVGHPNVSFKGKSVRYDVYFNES